MLSLGTTFHGLKILAHCGGGAYGDVYYCEDISGRRMAVKIVSKKRLGESWQRELKGVVNYRKITENAPGLLRIFHVEEDEDSFFYTMEAADPASPGEYVPDTLAHRLNGGPLPQDSVFRILSEIFSGIRTLHDAGFAHRDIKPDNILFVGGVPKLGDIGLISSLTATMTQIAGTLDFLPPELRAADGTTSSDRFSRQRNDLYAYGKVVYCAVTGETPHAWPTIPKELPLTLPLKLFLRLSMRLCDRDPVCRLDTVADVRAELTDIERKLTFGETLRDKLAGRLKHLLVNLRGAGIHLIGFLRKYGIAALVLLIVAIGSLWYFRPEPPFDLAKQQTKVYENAGLGFTMTIPAQWEILSAQTIQRLLDERAQDEDEQDPLEKKRMEFSAYLLRIGGEAIYCDFDHALPDNILIQPLPPGIEAKELDIPDDELRIRMRQLLQEELEFNAEIYEIKHMTLNGVKCIYVDLSYDPRVSRISNYLFLLPDRSFFITLTAKTKTFAERRAQFAQVLDTLSFTK